MHRIVWNTNLFVLSGIGFVIAVCSVLLYSCCMSDAERKEEVLKWRGDRTNNLRTKERSWFGLAGIFWLKEGENTFGSGPSCDIVLKKDVPKKAGVFQLNNGMVLVRAEPGVEMTCNGGKLPSSPLHDDQKATPDFLYLDKYIFVVLQRGNSTLIRLWDIEHPNRKALTDLNYYPYKTDFCIEAKFVRYSPAKVVTQKDIIGIVSDTYMSGYVVFKWEGKEYRLDAEDIGDGLFLAFRDETNNKATYSGGRYLVTEKPENNKVMIDFNKAYNPPCAYTLYATCTLPGFDNRLPIAIEAGEQKYQEH